MHFQHKNNEPTQIPEFMFHPKNLWHVRLLLQISISNQTTVLTDKINDTLGLLIKSAFGAAISLPDGSSLFLKMLCLCFMKNTWLDNRFCTEFPLKKYL